MRWRRTTFGALLVIAITGLVVPTAASPAREAKPKRKTFSVRVATPVAGDANVTVVTFRGRLVGRPTLRAPRRLSPGLLALAATRRLSGGRTQVWFAVLRRGPGATSRKLASASGASQANADVRFGYRGEYARMPNVRASRFVDLYRWRDQPPAICETFDPDDPESPRNPRPIASWAAELALDLLIGTFLEALCDEPQDPELAKRFGIPHTNLRAFLPRPNVIAFGGTISAASTGTLVKHLPAGTYTVLGPDAPRCSPGVQGATHFVRCNVPKPAAATLELILAYRELLQITLAALSALLESGVFDEDGDFYGPYEVAH
jgi:hypothetical protein